MKRIVGLMLQLSLTCLLLSTWAWPQQSRISRRLTRNELKQLADILFRRPERHRVDVIEFRYVIAPVNGVENIEVVLEPDPQWDDPGLVSGQIMDDLEVYRFTRHKCMTFLEDNFGRVMYAGQGTPRATDIYLGDPHGNGAYDDGLRYFKSTPSFTFRREEARHTCATLKLLDDPLLNNARRQLREAEEAERASYVKPRSNRLPRKQLLQVADAVTRAGFPVDFSGHRSLRLQYQIVPEIDLDQNGKQIGEDLEVMVHSKRLQIGEYLRFRMNRAHSCLNLALEFTADVLRYKSGPLKGRTEIDDPTNGGDYVIHQLEDDMMDDIFPSPLYIVPSHEIRNTCAQVTSEDRRYSAANEPKRLTEEHPPTRKQLSGSELQQLADALFRLPENQKVKTIQFHYVIAYSEKAEGESIEMIVEPVLRHEPPGFEEFKFKRAACLEFTEVNLGTIVYDKQGRAEVDDDLEGGLVLENSYYDGMRNIRSTPLFTFHKRQRHPTCAWLELAKTDWLIREHLHDGRKEEAEEDAHSKRLPRDFYR
jgi:hypothetical protein